MNYGPNKAYLQIPSSLFDTSADYVGLEFEDETDSISNVENSELDGTWYTVSGMRVNHPTKGVYIHNGKKVVVK